MMNVQNVFTVLCIVGFVLALAACIYALVSYIKLKRLYKSNCEKFDALLFYPRSTDKVQFSGFKTCLLTDYVIAMVEEQKALEKRFEKAVEEVTSKVSEDKPNE